MSVGTHKLYAFGNFSLDLEEEVLRHENVPVNLTPKAFHLLKILVQNHGHIVEKDRLISEVWADSFVEDGNLAVNVAMLRKALGDNAAGPRYIETVARRGYRFIAEVVENPAQAESHDVSPHVSVHRSRFLSGRRSLGLGLVVTMGLASGLAWYFSLLPFSDSTVLAPILSQSFRSEQLTSSGNAGSAAISPDGKYIAFTDKNNGKWSIWLRQLATSEDIPITAPSDDVYSGLTFSRDGNLLFFVRGFPGKKLDLFRVSAFGGVPVKLIERTEGWLSVAYDNKSISFVRCMYEQEDNCSLFVADIDGKNERKLITRPRPFRIGDNQFSPDGRSIAFATGHSATGSNDFVLKTVDLKDGRESEITQQKFFDIRSLKWLPNSDHLLMTARQELAGKNSFWRVSAATGEIVQIKNDGANYLGFNLDDEARNSVAIRVSSDYKIWISTLDDPNNPKILAEGEYANFTPDGKVVYQSNNSDIWMIDANSGEKRQLTNDPSSDINPILSTNGKHIFFTSNRQGQNHIWRMNLDGGDQRQISRIEGGYPRFATPDGKWVYYESSLGGSMRKIAFDGSAEVAVPELDGFAHAFSPDGRQLAYFYRDPEDNGNLRIGIRDLLNVTRLASRLSYSEPGSKPTDLRWSSDNKTLYFITESGGKYSLWRTSVDEDKPTFIGRMGTEIIQRFAIAPDVRSIITVRGDWRHDAVLLSGLR